VIVNLWRYRAFIVRNAASDIRYRYAGSAAGVLWHVINPLAQIVIYTLVFSQLMTIRLPGTVAVGAFALYLCAGILPWTAFSECVLRGANAFVENAAYLKKLPIPEQVFVAQTAMTATMSLGVSMALLLAVSVFVGGVVGPAWLGVPVVLALFQGFGFGLGLFFGTLNVFVRDVGQALMIGLQLWMWVTPIVYVEDILPAGLRALAPYNPAYPFIDALHRMVVLGVWPPLWQWPMMLLWAALSPVVGYLVLRRLRPEIRDAI
jgi:ABC-type polysaccharide/polyol phosphate export permease